jgi:putative nucleotidyltransferase with HDIG domain
MNEKLAKQLEDLVLKRIAEDKLSLPTMPAVAAKCLELLRNTDFSFKTVAAILEQDPVLVAQVLRMATSAAFGGGTKRVSLTEGLTRLGAKTVRTLLVEACAQKVFVSRDPNIAGAAKRLWEHSVAVAILARDLFALLGGSDSEEAYLAGLLHDVGKPVIASILLEAERQITLMGNRPWIDSEEWVAVIKKTHRTVGMALTEKWNLPPAVSKCIKDCSEYDAGDRSSVANVVCLGNALAKQTGIYAEPVDLDDVKALVMIGRSLLGVDDALMTKLVGGLRDRIHGIYD